MCQIGAHVLSVKSTKSFENFSNNRCPSKDILALTVSFELVKVSKNSNTKSVFWFLQKIVDIKKFGTTYGTKRSAIWGRAAWCSDRIS
jgi:hypothetical protein